LIVVRENADPAEVSWERLRDQVAALAAHLRRWGIRPGDRVGAYLPMQCRFLGPLSSLLREARSVSRRADKLGADVTAVQDPTIQQPAAEAGGSSSCTT
jgi:non-ribosomal peptide synthetase component E (peptide arylation enzyme)